GSLELQAPDLLDDGHQLHGRRRRVLRAERRGLGLRGGVAGGAARRRRQCGEKHDGSHARSLAGYDDAVKETAEDRFRAWLAAVEGRHLAKLTFPEVRRALVALSSLYVER